MRDRLPGTPIYLDHAATTPVDPRVAALMSACLADGGDFANPASNHRLGRKSAATVTRARSSVAALIGARPADLVWTSGATESNNLAILGAARFRADRGRHLITMPTEHKAVVETFRSLSRRGFEVSWLEPGSDGVLPPDALERAIRDDTQLVSVMHVNNETGVMQDLDTLGGICRRHDVLFHTDAAQSAGKLPIDVSRQPVDLLSMTAHKFHGPQGIGALYIADRPGCRVEPILYGGEQERGLRPGTLAVHQVAGFGLAAEIAADEMDTLLQHLEALRDRLWQGISSLPGLTRNGDDAVTFPGILNVSADGVEGESLLLALDPVCVASGSACNAQSGESSYVLRALGRDDEAAQSAIRFSFGRATSTREIDTAAGIYRSAIEHLRSIGVGRSVARA